MVMPLMKQSSNLSHSTDAPVSGRLVHSPSHCGELFDVMVCVYGSPAPVIASEPSAAVTRPGSVVSNTPSLNFTTTFSPVRSVRLTSLTGFSGSLEMKRCRGSAMRSSLCQWHCSAARDEQPHPTH